MTKSRKSVILVSKETFGTLQMPAASEDIIAEAAVAIRKEIDAKVVRLIRSQWCGSSA